MEKIGFGPRAAPRVYADDGGDGGEQKFAARPNNGHRPRYRRPSPRDLRKNQKGLCMQRQMNEAESIWDILVCPLSRERLKNPVRASDGFTYECQALREALATAKSNRSPMTGNPLEREEYQPGAPHGPGGACEDTYWVCDNVVASMLALLADAPDGPELPEGFDFVGMKRVLDQQLEEDFAGANGRLWVGRAPQALKKFLEKQMEHLQPEARDIDEVEGANNHIREPRICGGGLALSWFGCVE